MRPLVIIDMQTGFRDCFNKDTLTGCQNEIRQAMKRRDWVFFVQYDGYGDIDRRLTRVADGYPYKKRVWKWKDDGSDKIILRLIKLGLVRLKPTFDLNDWIIKYHEWTYTDEIVATQRKFRRAVVSAPAELRLCGVNLDYCVEETYGGLWKQLGKTDITICASAVHTEQNDMALAMVLKSWKNKGNQRIEGKREVLRVLNAKIEAEEKAVTISSTRAVA